MVADKLRLEWSPYQVAGWLKRTYPQDETRQVSHETIYRTLFIQARGAPKKELLQHLRRTRGMRRSRHHTSGRGRRSGGAWPLGGRSVLRQQQQPDCHPGGTSDALPDTRASGGQGQRDGDQCAHQAGAQTAAGVVQVTNLGSRLRDGGAQALLAGDRREGLLLRSPTA